MPSNVPGTSLGFPHMQSPASNKTPPSLYTPKLLTLAIMGERERKRKEGRKEGDKIKEGLIFRERRYHHRHQPRGRRSINAREISPAISDVCFQLLPSASSSSLSSFPLP